MFLDFIWSIIGKIVFFTGAITTKSSFPKPLSKEDEERYLRLSAQGDKHARNMLVKHNMRLVAHIVKKYAGAAETDDLISVGSIGLIKAISSYQPGHGTALATYTARCIENEILMHLRRTVKLKSEVSFDEPLNTDWEGNELMLSDVMGTDGDVVYKKIENGVETELLEVAMTKLNDREREIMELRYGLNGGEEKTQREVADMLGISQSYISRLEKKIIVRLKKEFSKMV